MTPPSPCGLTKQIENILQVLPDTTKYRSSNGASPIEKFWLEDLRRAYQPFTNWVTFDWLNDALLRCRHALHRTVSRPREVANAPIFSFVDNNFGHGIVGGPSSPPNGSRERVRPL